MIQSDGTSIAEIDEDILPASDLPSPKIGKVKQQPFEIQTQVSTQPLPVPRR
jgi:hypothetical protein